MIIFFYFLYFLIISVLVVISFLAIWSFVITFGKNQQIFISSKFPDPLPDGFYKGYINFFHFDWIGKDFDSKGNYGFNVFKSNNKQKKLLKFKTYKGKALSDSSIDVLKIDYNLKTNPFPLCLILDELRQISLNKYIGKASLLLGFMNFTIAYFFLEK